MAIAGEEADVSGSAVRMVSGRGDLLAVGKVSVRDGVVHVKPEKVLAQADC